MSEGAVMEMTPGKLPAGCEPVYQRGHGDCFRACVATLLGCTYDQMGDAPTEPSDHHYWPTWAARRGLEWYHRHLGRPPVELRGWIGIVEFTFEEGTAPPDSDAYQDPNGFWHHACLFSHDRFVHDPSPSQIVRSSPDSHFRVVEAWALGHLTNEGRALLPVHFKEF